MNERMKLYFKQQAHHMITSVLFLHFAAFVCLLPGGVEGSVANDYK